MAEPSASRARPIIAATLILVAIALVAIARVQRPVRLGDDDAPRARLRPPWPDMRVELNTASAAELAALPGLGPRLAERIIDDRRAHGPFKSVEDLDRVPMIGPKTIERIRPLVLVLTPAELRPSSARPAEPPDADAPGRVAEPTTGGGA